MAAIATLVSSLTTRYANIASELAALDSSEAGGKPNVSGEGGGVDHVGYKDGLYREMEGIEKRLAGLGYDVAGNALSHESWQQGVV